LVEERRNCEELKEINQGYKETISQQRTDLSDLKAEMELAKCNVGIARKGNSMFSEFVDERLKLEDDLKTLKFERDNLARTLSETQQQLEVQKQQISSMFLLASQRLNHNAEASIEEVVRLRSQLKSLNAQLHALEMKQVDVATLGSVDLSDEMARDIISSLRSRLNEKENSLQDLRMDRDRIQDALCAESAKARQASSRVAFLEAEVANLNQIITNEKFSLAFQKHSSASATTRKRHGTGTVEKIADPPLLSSSSSTATSANVSFTVAEKVDENRTHADEHIETKRKRVQWAEEPEKILMDQNLPGRTTTNATRRGRYLQNVKTNGNDLIFNPQ